MHPKIMGIINATPDSFSDGGSNKNIELLLKKIEKWLDLGVDILDIGGESTRPGSDPVSVDDEIGRTMPIISSIIKHFPQAFISIDTMKYEVAKAAVEAGARMINDVSGLTYNPSIAELSAANDIDLIIMHMPNMPKTMQNNPTYIDLLEDVSSWLDRQIKFAQSKGVKKIYADIGIGFGKSMDDNWTLLQNLSYFQKLGVPMLLGISRKRFIGELLELPEPNSRDCATMMIHSLLKNENVEIIRVHDVESAIQMRKISKALNK